MRRIVLALIVFVGCSDMKESPPAGCPSLATSCPTEGCYPVNVYRVDLTAHCRETATKICSPSYRCFAGTGCWARLESSDLYFMECIPLEVKNKGGWRECTSDEAKAIGGVYPPPPFCT